MVTKQDPNVIANPSSNQPKGPQMNDRDRMNDCLATEKYLCQSINTATWEASHDQLHQDLKTILNQTQECHRNLYNLMFKKGWYKLQAADQMQIDNTYQQFSNYTAQLPYQNQMQ
ncbi:hypothetical protein GCM10010965_10770 [Caldalkalibacillus thermarum]|uniref:spore coat protein n=1 Tax=Caldalkalibacillus thermarum TaxID=296745 RepID=UPI00166343E8|nr:spore coat protein [Caldalkalibacillus thermarum]GGK19580.1 hypothetical protein GCM10010965_10770 [Caldalkalibacillus thermarum]